MTCRERKLRYYRTQVRDATRTRRSRPSCVRIGRFFALGTLRRSLSAREAELAHLRLDALIVSDDLQKWTTPAGQECGPFIVAESTPSRLVDIALEQIRPIGRRKQAPPPTADSWACIFRTSGTTGTLRAPGTHGNSRAMADKMQRWLQLTPADLACIMPIYNNAGLKATLLAPLLVGCSVALPSSRQPRIASNG